VTLLRSAATVSGLTLVSRITGLARDMILARLFGAGAAWDAFTVAFRLPNLLRRLFAEGAFSQAFVPIFAEVRSREGEARLGSLFSHVASALLWTVLAVVVVGVVGAPLLVAAIASGFIGEPAVFDLATLLTRWTFPYILFMALVACSAGALNSFGFFAIPAFTPVLLNLSLIACALFLAPHIHPPILALAIGVCVGGAAQLLLQVRPLAKIGLLPKWSSILAAWADPAVRRVLKKMGPAVFAVSVSQLSLVINTNVASFLGQGTNSWLYYADRLMEFPTALLGAALGTVLLPNLSRAHADGRTDEYSRLLDVGLRMTVLIGVPAAIGLGLLARALIAVMFLGGRFSVADVAPTAAALTGYAVGLIGLIAIKILAPGFYARQDIRTPVKIAVAVLIATQFANLALVPWLAHAGLALSVSLGATANAGLLLIGLRRSGAYRPGAGWPRFALQVLVASLALAVLLWVGAGRVDWSGGGLSWPARATRLAALITAGGGAYFGVLWLSGLRPDTLRSLVR
jgi:putative peptidoglycan lipid II flippase